jgi:hypothetical protein
MTATVYAGQHGGVRERKTCPLCAGHLTHTRAEHDALVGFIRYPLEPEVWGDDTEDAEIVSRGHHPADRFLARAATDDDVAFALDLADVEDLATLRVTHVWRRYIPRSRWEDSERVGAWWPCDGPGPGVCPFTVAALEPRP